MIVARMKVNFPQVRESNGKLKSGLKRKIGGSWVKRLYAQSCYLQRNFEGESN